MMALLRSHIKKLLSDECRKLFKKPMGIHHHSDCIYYSDMTLLHKLAYNRLFSSLIFR